MNCDICSRPAIARLTVDVEALDLANWPVEFLQMAGTQTTAPLCVKCLKAFMAQGMGVAEKLNPNIVGTPRLITLDPDEPVGDDPIGDDYTDEAGNTYTRTDRGWVLSEYGPDGPPSVVDALGTGRKRPDKAN